MDKLKYFLTCYFHLNEDFDSLDNLIKEFKKLENDKNQSLFIQELYNIIQTKNYQLASKIIEEYGYKLLNLEQTKRVIIYIYNQLLNLPAFLNTKDFYKDCQIVFCPICTPDPESATTLNLIEKAIIKKNGLQIYICKPCKLVWLTENIQTNNAQDYKNFMKTFGLKGLWKELKNIDYL